MEIDKEKVVSYVKTYAIIAKDKVVATWKSGTKGKFACVVGAVIILLGLKSCLTGGDDDAASGDLLGAEYRFSEEDFRTESNTEKMFYVKDGDDDGLKEVVPNLKNIPELLKNPKSLPEGFRPGSENNIGNVYYTDPDALINAGICTVVHVGDGWVVARTAWTEMFGDYSGFIYTQDEDVYIEKQRLKAGFYVLIGTQEVPLVNGSSKTMFSFVKIDRQSNQLALSALDYNLKAKEATEKENERRSGLRRTHAIEGKKQACCQELEKTLKGFSFRPFKSQLHFPCDKKEIMDGINSIPESFIIREGYGTGSNEDPEDMITTAINNHKWDVVNTYLYRWSIDADTDVAKYVKDVCANLRKCKRRFEISKVCDGCKFYIVNPDKEEQVSVAKRYSYSNMWELPVSADFYCVKKEDVNEFDDLKDGNKFVETWEKKYGGASNR